MTSRLLAALQFLTVLPVRTATRSASEGAAFFPIVGVLLGFFSGAVCEYGTPGFGRPIASLLAIAFLVAITGALHEDGLADVADAFRAGRPKERIVAILKDSRIGTYGGLALVLSVVIRWQALAACRTNTMLGLAAAIGLSRASLVVIAGTTPPLGDGLGSAFASGLSSIVLYSVAAQALAIAILFGGWRRGLAMLLATALVIAAARAYFMHRVGGINGDCMGATCQAVETVNLLILLWRPVWQLAWQPSS